MDKTSFTAAVERYQDMVYRVALHVLASPQDADDAVQEVFLKLYTAQKPFQGEEHLRRWLLRVTVNHCRDVLRSPWRKRRASLDELPPQPVFQQPEQEALYQSVMALPEIYRIGGPAEAGDLGGDHPSVPGPGQAEGAVGGGVAG